MTSVLVLFGRLHPLIVHMPVTFLLTGGLLELARLRWKAPFLAEAAFGCFGVGVVTALFAVGSGWILEAHSHQAPDEVRYIELHEGFAVATLISAAVAFTAQFLWRASTNTLLIWLRRILAWVTLGLVAVTGHLGALAVWGGDWFS